MLKDTSDDRDTSDDENDENIENINGIKIYLNNLMKQVNETLLIDIRQHFQKYLNGNIKENQLRDILKPYNIILSNKKFHSMFARIDVKKKGTVNFLQFTAYLASEFEIQRKHNSFLSNNDRELSTLTPILQPKKILEYGEVATDIRQSIYIVFLPNKLKQSQKVADEPEYIVCNESGKIVRYTSDFQWKCTHKVVMDVLPITVNSLVLMPEFNVICLSVLGGELKFYDVSSGQFKLCLNVRMCSSTVVHIAHVYTVCERQKTGSSKLAISDVAGGVSVLEFLSSEKCNQFNNKSGDADETPAYIFDELLGGTAKRPPMLRAYEYPGLHPKRVEQVEFYNSGRSFVSVSMSDRQSMAQCHVQTDQCASSVDAAPVRYTSNVTGFSCVCAVRDTHLVTGSPDGTVKLWDVADHGPGGQADSTVLLHGHNKGIKYVSYNAANGHLYSVSTECVIKVWDLRKKICLLTFNGLTSTLSQDNSHQWPFAVMYFNWFDQTIIVVDADCTWFLTVECGKPMVADREGSRSHDKKSHDNAVVKTMYNRLFQVLISVSAADSSICVWDLRTGDAIVKWSMAHTEEVHCEILPVEITAANFDPTGGLLVTGAANGSVHVWNPNNGKCLNRLRIPSGGRISELVWLPDKILATGFDKLVTEFNDPLSVSKGKVWLSSHDEAVLSACVKLPSLFVTTSRDGVMGFWRLETGQLIKKYKARMRPDSRKSSTSSKSQTASASMSKSTMSFIGSRIIDSGVPESKEERHKRLYIKQTPREHYAAVATHFLRARPEDTNVGTLLVATRNGVVQIWCTYKVPEYMGQFMAIHIVDDYVTAMASNRNSEYLFTSFESGYVKTWMITNFGQPKHSHTVVGPNIASLRLRFPFLIDMFFIGRAERAASKNAAGPRLVNAYKAHLQRISHVEYIDKMELVITSSTDNMIRIWTLAGHYVGTLGMTWPRILKTNPVTVKEFKIPVEIKRSASFTTVQVMKDGMNSDSQSPAIWEKLELLRQQRDTRVKKSKRQLYDEKCPDLPLHDIYGDQAMKTKFVAITRPVVIKVHESKPRIRMYKHVPLSNLDKIPVIPKLEQVEQESITTRTKLVFFKK